MSDALRLPAVSSDHPWRCYELLLDSVPADAAPAEVQGGAIWTLARSAGGCALVATPERTRPDRSIVSRDRLADLLRAWQPQPAATGLVALGAMLAGQGDAAANATPLDAAAPGDHPVFRHFASLAAGSRVMVVGRQPGLAPLQAVAEVTVLDARPAAGELPLAAADYLLPEADWVFLSAASLVDKSFPHLAALAADARLVLTGAATPWLPVLREFGVDYLAGVRVADPVAAATVVGEGGGSRIFDTAVEHAVLDLARDEAGQIKDAIAAVFARRARLKAEMDAWYAQGRRRFPGNAALLRTDAELASLDARYRQLWDAGRAAERASA